MATPGVRKRRHHHRSRNGCITCKQRHMRCDEAKPYCHNCLKSGGSCGYYATGSNSNSPTTELSEEDTVPWSPINDTELNSLLPTANSDPFQVLRDVMAHESAMLFDQPRNHHLLVRTPMTERESSEAILTLATSDEVLMHGVILLAANHWVRICSNPGAAAFSLAHHKVEAIRMINERLRHPEMATMDGTIGAVAAMSLSEVTSGAPDTAAHHLNGLEHLIRLRGDFHARQLQSTVRQMILVADALTSSATSSNRRFSASMFGADGSSRRPSISSDTSSSSAAGAAASSAFLTACTLESSCLEAIVGIDWDTTKMFLDLRSLSADVAANNAGIHVSSPGKLIERISAVQKHIDSLIHRRADSTSTISSSSSSGAQSFGYIMTDPISTISARSCALAGSIYIYLFLLRTPIENPIFDWMIDLVKTDIESTETVIREFYTVEHIFWILFVAGCAAIGRSERLWFRNRLEQMRPVLQLGTWGDAQSTLEKLVWVKAPGELHGRSLWAEIAET